MGATCASSNTELLFLGSFLRYWETVSEGQALGGAGKDPGSLFPSFVWESCRDLWRSVPELTRSPRLFAGDLALLNWVYRPKCTPIFFLLSRCRGESGEGKGQRVMTGRDPAFWRMIVVSDPCD